MSSYDPSIQARKTLALDPHFPGVHAQLGWSYISKSMPHEAVAEFQIAVSSAREDPLFLGGLAYAYAIAGERAEAQKMLDDLEQRAQTGSFPAAPIAQIHLGLGHKQRSLEWLEKAVDQRWIGFLGLKTDATWDPLRTEPRFQNLLRRMNLSP